MAVITISDNAAIARLEAHLEHVLAAQKKQAETLEALKGQVAEVKDTLAQSKGGMRVFAWLGFGSLGALLATAAAVWQMLKGAN